MINDTNYQQYLFSKPIATINVHRILAQLFVQNTDNKEFVDHIKGDKADNTPSKLRWVNKSENAMNSKIRSHNTSGYKNIESTYNRQKNPIWRIRITIDKKIVTKTFKRDSDDVPQDVIKCRDKMLKDLHKDFACFRI